MEARIKGLEGAFGVAPRGGLVALVQRAAMARMGVWAGEGHPPAPNRGKVTGEFSAPREAKVPRAGFEPATFRFFRSGALPTELTG